MESSSEEPERDAINSGLGQRTRPAPWGEGRRPSLAPVHLSLVQAAGGLVKGGDAEAVGVKGALRGAGMGLPWVEGRPGVPGRHQAELGVEGEAAAQGQG